MIPMVPDGFRQYPERGSKRTSVDLPLVCANGPRDQPCSYPGASSRGDCRPITARMSTAGSRGTLGTPTSRSAPPASGGRTRTCCAGDGATALGALSGLGAVRICGPSGRVPTWRSAVPAVSAVFVSGRVPAGGACSAWRQGHRSASRSNPRVGVRALAGFARIMPRSDSHHASIQLRSCPDPSRASCWQDSRSVRCGQHRTQFRKSRCFESNLPVPDSSPAIPAGFRKSGAWNRKCCFPSSRPLIMPRSSGIMPRYRDHAAISEVKCSIRSPDRSSPAGMPWRGIRRTEYVAAPPGTPETESAAPANGVAGPSGGDGHSPERAGSGRLRAAGEGWSPMSDPACN